MLLNLEVPQDEFGPLLASSTEYRVPQRQAAGEMLHASTGSADRTLSRLRQVRGW